MTETLYPRAMICDPATPGALRLAGGWAWFAQVEIVSRTSPSEVIAATELPAVMLEALCAPRRPMAGLDFDAPRIMGILNVTPDSFSDGGLFEAPKAAIAHAAAMDAADILDIGGESTRPGAIEVSIDDEIARTAPIIKALAAQGKPLSIDTRKSVVAQAALAAGAQMVNDVSGMNFDPDMADFLSHSDVPACLMHSRGHPATMQIDPRYDNVLLDVYDALEVIRDRALTAGIAAHNIMLDPGIGFGKTLAHNLALMRGLSLFHALGCPLLLGVSRKGFIGTLGHAPNPADRAPGSLALGLQGVAQGVQVLRVHDVGQTAQALALWGATREMGTSE